jgi:type VI secretion system protein ImpA
LTENGEEDPFYRINALAELSDKSTLTATLRQSILLRSNGDELTVRDAQALLDGSKTECPNFPGGRVRLVDELARAGKEATSVMMQIEGRLLTIRSWLVERLGESGAPEMEQLIKTATLINRAGRAGDEAQPDETATTSFLRRRRRHPPQRLSIIRTGGACSLTAAPMRN